MERTYTTEQLWTYRDLDTLGADMTRGVDLVGFEIEATDGGSEKSTKRLTTSARATWWSIPAHGSSVRRSCSRPR